MRETLNWMRSRRANSDILNWVSSSCALLPSGTTIIDHDVLYPLSFDDSAPSAGALEYLQDPYLRLLVDFFRNKGLAALKAEDRREEWYPDWIEYQAEHGIYASLLSPKQYSSRGHQFDLRKLVRCLEAFTYFSPAHTYSLHVSFLGLFPILMSSNEALKREAIAKLEAGELFAFGVSEKAHGSDLFANEFTVKSVAAGGLIADGSKYYIGNANAACMISVLAKKVDGASASPKKRSPFAFFALRSDASGFPHAKKIRTLGIRTAFVGEFEVKNHPVPESDLISEGRDAWEAAFGTVTLGKYFLGFGSVGICSRSFAEAIAHMRRRILYGKPVTEMPHIRATTAVAFARLAAMKFYAYRALDYLQSSSHDDRRYLLFNAVQKAKVSTEGVKVMELLHECIGARGVESETYFEMGLRDAQLIPGLEGSTHINFALTAQFLESYFADEGEGDNAHPPESLTLLAANFAENPTLMEARDRNPKTVAFAHFLKAYEPLLSVPNVRSFVEQVKAFRLFSKDGVSALQPSIDAGLIVAMGKCFATVAYAQLIAENCTAVSAPLSIVSVIFHGLIEDLSAEALKLSAMFGPGSEQRELLKKAVGIPETIAEDLESTAVFIGARYGV